jgi:hypothetical protein
MGAIMGKVFGRMVWLIPVMADKIIVCQRCRDKSKCSAGTFKNMGSLECGLSPYRLIPFVMLIAYA